MMDVVNSVLYGVDRINITFMYGPCNLKINGGVMTFHDGLDMTPITKVTAFERAKVESVTRTSYGGNTITLLHGDGMKTLYKHLADGSIVVKAGDIIERKAITSTAGNTGNTTGAHLHFEVQDASGKTQDPLPYLQGKKVIKPYEEIKITMIRPELPTFTVLVDELNFRDAPNGNRVKYIPKGTYLYLGHSQALGGYEWAEIVLDGKIVYCAIDSRWNTISTPAPALIPFSAEGVKDGQKYTITLSPVVPITK